MEKGCTEFSKDKKGRAKKYVNQSYKNEMKVAKAKVEKVGNCSKIKYENKRKVVEEESVRENWNEYSENLYQFILNLRMATGHFGQACK